MQGLCQISIAVISAFVLGLFVPRLLRRATAGNRPGTKNKQLQTVIESILKENRIGLWIGNLERFLILAGFWLDESTIIVGWFAFKIASKWQVWRDIVQIPAEIPGVKRMEWFGIRHDLGAYFTTRFLVGTLLNVLIALVSAYLGQNANKICELLFR